MIKKYDDFLIESIEQYLFEVDEFINENILKDGIGKFSNIMRKINQQQRDALQRIKDKTKELENLKKEQQQKAKDGLKKKLELRKNLIDTTTKDVRERTDKAAKDLDNVESNIKARMKQIELDKINLIQKQSELKDKVKDTVDKKREYIKNN